MTSVSIHSVPHRRKMEKKHLMKHSSQLCRGNVPLSLIETSIPLMFNHS